MREKKADGRSNEKTRVRSKRKEQDDTISTMFPMNWQMQLDYEDLQLFEVSLLCYYEPVMQLYCQNRRDFLVSAGALGMFSALRLHGAVSDTERPLVRFGMVTDVHYADKVPDARPRGVVGRRYYRESLKKLDAAVALFNARQLDFAIELGDFKDLTGGKPETLAHLDAVERSFSAFEGPRYHVLGNHDFDCLTEAEFYAHVTNDGKPMTRGYYAFERNDVTFLVLMRRWPEVGRPRPVRRSF